MYLSEKFPRYTVQCFFKNWIQRGLLGVLDLDSQNFLVLLQIYSKLYNSQTLLSKVELWLNLLFFRAVIFVIKRFFLKNFHIQKSNLRGWCRSISFLSPAVKIGKISPVLQSLGNTLLCRKVWKRKSKEIKRDSGIVLQRVLLISWCRVHSFVVAFCFWCLLNQIYFFFVKVGDSIYEELVNTLESLVERFSFLDVIYKHFVVRFHDWGKKTRFHHIRRLFSILLNWHVPKLCIFNNFKSFSCVSFYFARFVKLIFNFIWFIFFHLFAECLKGSANEIKKVSLLFKFNSK